MGQPNYARFLPPEDPQPESAPETPDYGRFLPPEEAAASPASTPSSLVDRAKTFIMGEGGSVVDRLNAPFRAGAQVLTGGFADEITAAVGAGLGKLGEAVGLSDPKPFAQRYREIQGEYLGADDAGARANPVGTLAGTGLAAAAPVGAVVQTGSKALPIAIGAGSGFGASRGDLTTPEGRREAVGDTLKGAAWGTLASRLQARLQRARTPTPARPAPEPPPPPEPPPSAAWERQAPGLTAPELAPPPAPARSARPPVTEPAAFEPPPAARPPRPRDPKTGRFTKGEPSTDPAAELTDIIKADRAAGATSIPEADRSTVEALRNVMASQSRAGNVPNQIHYPDPPDQAFRRYLAELPESAGGTAAQRREALKALTVGRYKGTEDMGYLVYRARAAGVPDEQIAKAAGFGPGKATAAPAAPAATPATPPRVPTSDEDLADLLRQSVGLGRDR